MAILQILCIESFLFAKFQMRFEVCCAGGADCTLDRDYSQHLPHTQIVLPHANTIRRLDDAR